MSLLDDFTAVKFMPGTAAKFLSAILLPDDEAICEFARGTSLLDDLTTVAFVSRMLFFDDEAASNFVRAVFLLNDDATSASVVGVFLSGEGTSAKFVTARFLSDDEAVTKFVSGIFISGVDVISFGCLTLGWRTSRKYFVGTKSFSILMCSSCGV